MNQDDLTELERLLQEGDTQALSDFLIARSNASKQALFDKIRRGMAGAAVAFTDAEIGAALATIGLQILDTEGYIRQETNPALLHLHTETLKRLNAMRRYLKEG